MRRQRFMPWAQVVLFLVTAWFLGSALIDGWDEITAFDWHRSPLHLLVTALILILCSFLQALLWSWLVRRSGARLTYRRGAQAYLLAHLARYIPGGVWPFAQMAVVAQGAGSSPVLFSGLLMVLQISVAASCALLALPLVPDLLGIPAGLPAALMAIGMFVALLAFPWLISLSLRRLSRLRGFSSLAVAEKNLRTSAHFQLFFSLLLIQVLSSLAFVVFVDAQLQVDGRMAVYLVAAWNAAWLGGFLAIPVPMGLGVRESLLALLLSPLMPGSLGAAIALLFRLFTVAIEMVLLALAAGLGAGRERPPGQNAEPGDGGSR